MIRLGNRTNRSQNYDNERYVIFHDLAIVACKPAPSNQKELRTEN